MLVVAGPNLTIDRTMRVPELVPGRVLRATEVTATPGGKGLNVARAAGALKVPAILVAFVPGLTGRAAAALIAEEGVVVRGLPCPGEIRSTAVMMEDGGRVTVLNEPGPELPAESWAAYEDEVARAVESARVLVCSGSLPPGAPDDGYARLAELARSRGVLTVVDVAGPALGSALDAAVDVVVPNLGEAEAVLGSGLEDRVEAALDARPRAVGAAQALVRRGARTAVVTAAAAGAALAQADGTVRWLPAPPARVLNPIGAGDAFAAGLAAALARGADPATATAEAVAAGAASVESPLAGDLRLGRMRELAALVDGSGEIAP